MLKKSLLISALCSSLLFSQEFKNDKFEIIAKNIHTQNNKIIAKGNVVVYSNNYYLSANEIIFNKKEQTFELIDNVFILKDNEIQTQSNYAKVNLSNESYKQSPVFLFDAKSNVWFSSKYSQKKEKSVDLGESILSSCDCIDPVWSIKVSSAKLNLDKKWLHAYNPKLYIKNVPVLYSPYFGFSLNRSRETGLLVPTLGYSQNDGVYFAQPIFFNLAKNYDLELIPQTRTNRGNGIYAYFRYADSPDSILKLKAGYFKEKKEYQKEFELKNQQHFGWNIDYERRNIFSSSKSNDGFYASINWLNDIEYKTLESDDTLVSSDKKIESKINYFYDKSEFYTGLYSRFYIDTEKDSNDTTLQELPQLQAHMYNRELFLKKLIASIDTKVINYTRPLGLTANIYELTLPISYTKYLFNDFLYFNIENKLSLNKYDYSDTFENGTLGQNELSFSIGSDLIKPYKNYLHTISLNAKYTNPQDFKKSGDIYEITNSNNELKAFPVAIEKKNIDLLVNQSLFDKKTKKEFINHKLSQSIDYDENKKPKLQDLENYLRFNFHKKSSFVNRLVYNVQDKEIIENMSNLSFNYDNFNLSLGYYNSKETPNSNKENLESYNVKTSYNLSRDYTISYLENYNLKEKTRNKQALVYSVKDKCWSLDLKYERELVPSTSTNSDGINQKVVYLNLKLKPLGGLKQKYKFEDKN